MRCDAEALTGYMVGPEVGWIVIGFAFEDAYHRFGNPVGDGRNGVHIDPNITALR